MKLSQPSARRNLFGYKSMVGSMVAITILSFLVWAHHFYTMGHGVLTNSIFSITTMAIAVPTGVKIFNWLFTMRKGKIVFDTPMLMGISFYSDSSQSVGLQGLCLQWQVLTSNITIQCS